MKRKVIEELMDDTESGTARPCVNKEEEVETIDLIRGS
jgi:hypothetical protein